MVTRVTTKYSPVQESDEPVPVPVPVPGLRRRESGAGRGTGTESDATKCRWGRMLRGRPRYARVQGGPLEARATGSERSSGPTPGEQMRSAQ